MLGPWYVLYREPSHEVRGRCDLPGDPCRRGDAGERSVAGGRSLRAHRDTEVLDEARRRRQRILQRLLRQSRAGHSERDRLHDLVGRSNDQVLSRRREIQPEHLDSERVERADRDSPDRAEALAWRTAERRPGSIRRRDDLDERVPAHVLRTTDRTRTAESRRLSVLPITKKRIACPAAAV